MSLAKDMKQQRLKKEMINEMNKKEILIITRHAVVNHGSILQSIATLYFFEKLGYHSKIIDYQRNDENYPNIIDTQLQNNNTWNKNFFTRMIYKIIKSFSLKKGLEVFRKYQNKYLNLTEKISSNDDFSKIDYTDKILCAGSDQLWGPTMCGELDDNYFLGFSNIKNKFSFSSSIGRDIALDDNFKKLLEDFAFVTVRERTAEIFLHNIGIRNVKTILDPTLMIEPKFWYDKANTIDIEDDYILVYKLHNSKEFEDYIKVMSKKKNLKIRRIGNSYDDFLLKGKTEFLVNPDRFLSLIKNARYVLTDSFHCVQFSIIFQKKFKVYLPSITGSRIDDFLNRFSLEDRKISDLTNYDSIDNEISYNEIHNKLEFDRKEFTDYIDMNLRRM